MPVAADSTQPVVSSHGCSQSIKTLGYLVQRSSGVGEPHSLIMAIMTDRVFAFTLGSPNFIGPTCHILNYA